MSRREVLRANQLRTPDMSAERFNDVLQDLYERVEKLERCSYFNTEVESDASGVIQAFVIAAPQWPVQACYLAKLVNLTDESTVALLSYPEWKVMPSGISFGPLYADVSKRYAVRVEVRG